MNTRILAIETSCDETAAAVVESAAAVLRPGGSLVYSTCTVTPEENESVIRGFMATRPGWRIATRDEAPRSLQSLIDDEGFMRLLPHLPKCHDMDGFFAVRLVREAQEVEKASTAEKESPA